MSQLHFSNFTYPLLTEVGRNHVSQLRGCHQLIEGAKLRFFVEALLAPLLDFRSGKESESQLEMVGPSCSHRFQHFIVYSPLAHAPFTLHLAKKVGSRWALRALLHQYICTIYLKLNDKSAGISNLPFQITANSCKQCSEPTHPRPPCMLLGACLGPVLWMIRITGRTLYIATSCSLSLCRHTGDEGLTFARALHGCRAPRPGF